MGSQILAVGGVRMFRYALGTLLLLAGTALLVAKGLAWLGWILNRGCCGPYKAERYARWVPPWVLCQCWLSEKGP